MPKTSPITRDHILDAMTFVGTDPSQWPAGCRSKLYVVIDPRNGASLPPKLVLTTAAELAYKPDEVLATILRYALFAVNLPDLAETPQRLDEVVSLGFQCNNWQRPAATPSA